MHRSGTSAVAGCLQKIGVEFGPRLMPPTQANEKGYYEHIDIVNLHDRLLMALDRGWDSVSPWPARWWEDATRTGRFREELLGLLQRDFGGAALWGVKDPRMCRLLAWWRPAWAALDTEPVFLIVVREPGEVAASLHRRDGISLTKARVLWLQHLLEAERETRGSRRLFIDSGCFLEDWAAALTPLTEVLGSSWGHLLAGGREANADFLKPALHRPPGVRPGNTEVGPVEVVAGWFKAQCGLGSPALSPTPDFADAAEWAENAVSIQPVQERVRDLEIELRHARGLAAWYEREWRKNSVRAARYKDRRESVSESRRPL